MLFNYYHLKCFIKTLRTVFTDIWVTVWFDLVSFTAWKSDLADEIKSSFFQAAVMSILLYGCTTWTLTKRMEEKLGRNYTRMLQAILNKSWRQHPTKQQLYGHLTPITKTIKVRRTRHAGHCWRSTLVEPFVRTYKGWATSSNIHTAALCRYGM